MAVEADETAEGTRQEAAARSERLIAALRDPRRYPHTVRQVEVLETHISHVLLAGEYAYKIKKAVNLGFLDFTSLESRRFYCNEELRLNRRTAPQIYLEVVPVTGVESDPVLGGDGPAIEYAVKMRRFPQDDLLDRIARRGGLLPQHVDALARSLAGFHSVADRAAGTAGGPPDVLLPALQNFEQILALGEAAPDRSAIVELKKWTEDAHASLRERFDARQRDGFIRECHGDLHLGNIVLVEGVPVPFDCIEFNPAFRWIDVMSEIAFLVMDLLDHGLTPLAFRFLNAHLELTGDYAGMRLLRFYLVYRAMVRAKVSLIRACQRGVAEAEQTSALQTCRHHVRLAQSLAAGRRPALIVMHGLSGSGKSTVAQVLAEILGAVRVRSDVERKRLHGMASQARSGAGFDAGIYTRAETGRTYERLAEHAGAIVDSGYPAIVDAACLQRWQRERFRTLATGAGVAFAIVSCTASPATLRQRVAAREHAAADPSEAGVDVLERQRASQELPTEDERAQVVTIDTERGRLPAEEIGNAVAARLGLEIAGIRQGPA